MSGLILDKPEPAHLRPSALARAMACPSSVFYAQFVAPQTSAYAAAGTAAHALAEEALVNALHGWTDSTLPDEINCYVEHVESVVGSHAVMLAHGDSPMFRLPGKWTDSTMAYVGIEAPVNLSEINPLFLYPGRCDCWVYVDGVLHIIDYKNGTGYCVDPTNNWQLIAYALGALKSLDSMGVDTIVDRVVLTIVQPLGLDGEPVKTADLSPDELVVAAKKISEFRAPTDDDEAALSVCPGEHCHWCRGALVCPAALEVVTQVPKLRRAPATDDLAIIAKWLGRREAVDQFFKDLEEHTKLLISEGKTIDGYTLKTHSRSFRDWRDESAAREEIYMMGWEDKLLTQKIKTPVQARAVAGSALDHLVQEEKKTYTNLVSTSDGKKYTKPKNSSSSNNTTELDEWSK